MANKYWVKNQTSASAVSADDNANWNDAVDGGGSAGKPGASDIAIIGHPTTVENNKGFANISWDITNVGGLVIYDGYKYSITTTKTTISFTGGGTNSIAITTGSKWEDIGFRVGMWITVAGSTSNNGSTYITAINNNVLTVNKTLTTEAAGDTVTVSTSMCLDVAANFECDYIKLNGTVKNSSGSSKTITLDGQFQAGSNNRYVLNGDAAQILNQDIITYKYNGNGGSQPTAVAGDATIYFDDGPYPNVQIYPALALSCDYKAAPTSNSHGEVVMYSFTVTNASSTLDPTVTDAKNDTTKVFRLLTTGLSYAPEILDTGFSTWIFKVSSSTWVFPVTGSASYGATDGTFKAYWYNVIIETPGSAGYAATLEGGRTLSVNSLKVKGDAVLRGQADKSSPSSIVASVSRPDIKGAWNFSQVADGIYASVISNASPITPSEGAGGTVQLSDNGGKFTSDNDLSFADNTLHVDRGIKITEGSDHPLTPASGFGQIWVDSDDSKLYFTDDSGTDHDLLASGGGGSGTVTNIATSAPITGGAITTTGTIGISAATTSAAGSMSGADKTKLDGIEASADVTDATNVTAAGALMDSEVTNLAQVKAFNSADYATAAQGAKADTALQPGTALAPGDPVSALANDAGYLDAATTPTSIYGRWELTSAVDGLAEATDNLLAVDDSSGFTRTGTLTGFSSGTFTATAGTAGTYLVYARLHFGDSTTGTSIAETSGNKYTIQILMYHGTTMEGFGRIQKNGFWVDDHFDCTSIITLADGDTLQIKHKIVDHAASSTKYRIKNGGGNPANAIIMVKLA